VQQVRTQIAGDLHTDIQTTLSDINVLSAMAKIKADKDTVRSKEYIEQISEKSSTMMESMDDILWSIDPQNDSMQKMLLRIQEFTDGLRKTQGVQIALNNYATLKDLSLDMRSRHEFLLFYKNALNFAVQQTGCTTITVTLELKKHGLLFKLVADCLNNPVENILTKQQKEEMQRRADALNAVLDIKYYRRTVEVEMQLPT
jgi:signal transduction histidine kinase